MRMLTNMPMAHVSMCAQLLEARNRMQRAPGRPTPLVTGRHARGAAVVLTAHARSCAQVVEVRARLQRALGRPSPLVTGQGRVSW